MALVLGRWGRSCTDDVGVESAGVEGVSRLMGLKGRYGVPGPIKSRNGQPRHDYVRAADDEE